VSTYDVETGTGGLDGSIQFEMDRPEVSATHPLSRLLGYKDAVCAECGVGLFLHAVHVRWGGHRSLHLGYVLPMLSTLHWLNSPNSCRWYRRRRALCGRGMVRIRCDGEKQTTDVVSQWRSSDQLSCWSNRRPASRPTGRPPASRVTPVPHYCIRTHGFHAHRDDSTRRVRAHYRWRAEGGLP
jgi:hypothetical protein